MKTPPYTLYEGRTSKAYISIAKTGVDLWANPDADAAKRRDAWVRYANRLDN